MVKWTITSKVACIPSTGLGDEQVCQLLQDHGIYNLVDVGRYDCSFAWRFGHDRRRWQVAATLPGDSWLHDLREFCLYEMFCERKVLLRYGDDDLQSCVETMLLGFLGRSPARQLLEQLIRTQQDRALQTLGRESRPTTSRWAPERFLTLGLVCHATEAVAARQIVRGGRILAASHARRMSGEILAREPRNAAGDPADYFDYVMFGPAVHPGLDKLVNERLLGRPPSWEEMREGFVPAVRFFFRRQDILRHPRFCCDGLHEKIRDWMELEPHLAAALVPEGVEGCAGVAEDLRTILPRVPLVCLSRGRDDPEQWGVRVSQALMDLELARIF